MRVPMIAATALTVLSLSACDKDSVRTGAPLANGGQSVAMLRTPDGADVGRATATEVGGGLRVTLDVRNMPAGTHGAHIHAVGHCDAPDFATAGPHWNPTTAKHGTMNPQGPHQGDLPNLIVGTNGRGTIGMVLPGATMAGLLDADGAAMVVHANPDDMMTDPSGNSGGRVACGVFGAS